MQPVGRARVTKCTQRAAASHALNLRAAGLAVLQRSITLHTACMARVSVFFTHVSVDHPQGPVIFTEVCSAAGGSTLFPAVVSFVFFGVVGRTLKVLGYIPAGPISSSSRPKEKLACPDTLDIF